MVRMFPCVLSFWTAFRHITERYLTEVKAKTARDLERLLLYLGSSFDVFIRRRDLSDEQIVPVSDAYHIHFERSIPRNEKEVRGALTVLTVT